MAGLVLRTSYLLEYNTYLGKVGTMDLPTEGKLNVICACSC